MISQAVRRTAVVAALATVGTGLVGVTGSAQAHVFQRRLDTTLSIRASEPGPAGNAVVAGRLRSRGEPVAGKKVRLLSKEAGADNWTIEARERTTRRGKVQFRVSPDVTTRYRLAFLGTRRFQPARSAVVNVVPRPTALTIDATPSVVDPDGETTITGVLTNEGEAFAGQTVELRSRVPGTVGPWILEGTDTTGADGSVSFTATPEIWMNYVLVFKKTDTAPAARSEVVRVRVRDLTYISIEGKVVKRGFAILGRLHGDRFTIPHRRITLQSLAEGESEWMNVATKRTNDAGRVRFLREHVPGTSYRLFFAGGNLYVGSTSPVVVS